MTDFRGVVVPGFPPPGPPLSLIRACVTPPPGEDPEQSKPDPAQMANLPADLRAELEKRAGEAWVRGITWAPEHHNEAIVRDPCDETTIMPLPANSPGIQVAIPYLIIAGDACSTFGFDERDFRGRATRMLDAAKYKAVEKEFATGALAAAAGWPNAFLQNEATVTDLTPGGGPPSVARGIQILQDALAEHGFGGQGMLHVQRQTASNLLTVIEDDPHFIVDDDGMHDMFGNIIVPGVGYPGLGPKGAAPAAGSSWIYATDMVAFREEEDATIFPDSFAEATHWGRQTKEEAEGKKPDLANTIRFEAQKFAVTQWDVAAHFACRVKLAE